MRVVAEEFVVVVVLACVAGSRKELRRMHYAIAYYNGLHFAVKYHTIPEYQGSITDYNIP